MNPLTIQTAQLTGIGGRGCNEDCIAMEHRDGYACMVLSDGAGGHGNGARASQVVVQRVLEGWRSRPPSDRNDLCELLLDAHDAVLAAQRELARVGAQAAMHATVVVLVTDLQENTALWGHLGDSRLYQWRRGQLNSVTRDDSAVQSVIDSGLVSAADAKKIRDRGLLLAALGTTEDVTPHVSDQFQLQPGDAFLLCSDGWWGGSRKLRSP